MRLRLDVACAKSAFHLLSGAVLLAASYVPAVITTFASIAMRIAIGLAIDAQP
jgi:hypothetical protein